MKLPRLLTLGLLTAFLSVGVTHAETQPLTPGQAKQVAIAEDAYIYGYSLLTTEVTRVQMSNVPKQEGLKSPMGQFTNVLRYPPGDYRGVSAPNADTLYSIAWVDLGHEPTVFTHPDMGKRYFLFPMYSLWMPVVASPGSRTEGGHAGKYLLTGPNWDGEVPAGMTQIKSPTRYMVIIGRTYADGTEQDYKTVNALQAQYKLTPLSSHGNKDYVFKAPPVNEDPGFDLEDKPQQVILDMSLDEYFSRLAHLMADAAPPAPEDGPIVARMARIGIKPGHKFHVEHLDPAVQAALVDLPKRMLAKITAQAKTVGKKVNGWLIPGAAGSYGTDYNGRALIAAIGWPANLSQDAVYPTTFVDGNGKALNGANKYTLTFKKGQTPPVNGFWSITLYVDDGGWWFYPNALNKFTVSMRDNPKFNQDGSLTLYFQHDSPGADKEANWLPSPAGNFLLTMRMYWPKTDSPTILPPGKGDWAPPAVQKVP